MTETPQHSLLNSIEGTDLEKRLAVVKVLLYLGVNVNLKSETLETALHIAVRNNCFEIAQLLLLHKADVDAVDLDRRTPLHLCAEFSDLKMAELLLKGYEIQSRAAGIKSEIIQDMNIQDFQLAVLLLKCCDLRVNIREIRHDVIDILESYLWYNKSLDNSCSCL